MYGFQKIIEIYQPIDLDLDAIFLFFFHFFFQFLHSVLHENENSLKFKFQIGKLKSINILVEIFQGKFTPIQIKV